MHPDLHHPAGARLPRTSAVVPGIPVSATSASESRTSQLPADWIHDRGLRAFRGDAGYLGHSIAALKLYLTLVVSQDAAGDPAPILLSYKRIATVSGLSDPLICAGKKALRDRGLVTASDERPGGTTTYRLTGLRPAAAASLRHAAGPGARIAALHALTCRRAPNLAALKTYLLLSAQGSDPDGVAGLDVDAAADLVGLSHVKVVAALATLQDLGLAEAPAVPTRWAERRRVRLLPLR